MSIHAVRDRGAAVRGRRPRLAPLAGLLSAGTLLGLSTNLVKHAADQGLDPLILLTWSVAGAGLAVSIVNAVAGRAPRPGRRNTAYFAIAALLGVVTPNLLLYAAVPRVGAGFATLAIAFPPLLTYLGALALRMESFDARRAAGVGVALAGAIYLAYRKVAAPEAPEDGAVFRCKGLHGMDVRVAEGDLRMFVSYGPNAEQQSAASQTIPVFNTIGKTLEWRLDDGAPFATILRYRWDSDNGEGSTLVVTKIGATDACHIAYVQATENAKANALAREIADGQARGFSCGRDKPRTYGADGKQTD